MLNRKNIYLVSLWLILIGVICPAMVQGQVTLLDNHRVGTTSGKYSFTTAEIPDQLIEISPAYWPATGLTFQWEWSTLPLSGYAAIPGATQSSYSFSSPVSQTIFLRRRTVAGGGNFTYSNVVKINLVLSGWEEKNYVKEITILKNQVTSRSAIDALPIGEKLERTSYLDGIGRVTQNVAREEASLGTPGLWGDIVSFTEFDALGREAKTYLPYTTTVNPGKSKSNAVTDQGLYYSSTFNETIAYGQPTYEQSPLSRVLTMKKPGAAWAANVGQNMVYSTNDAAENVRIFRIGYSIAPPTSAGFYPSNSLFKYTISDENGLLTIRYTTIEGNTILEKTQLDNSPTQQHSGWICTYYVYDDFGQLRCQIQPEAVRFLDQNNWDFSVPNGLTVALEQCFFYNYDVKGRLVWKKMPGASPLNMVYDVRDRLVFTQDGNQASMSTQEWTNYLYDELDRNVATAICSATIDVSVLQDATNAAPAVTPTTLQAGGINIVNVNLSFCPIIPYLNQPTLVKFVDYKFYDNYYFVAASTFNSAFTNYQAYALSDPNVLPIVQSGRTSSLQTGSATRVLGTDIFLLSTSFYDEYGLHIQQIESNIKGGADVTTKQYHFDGRILSISQTHTMPGTGYSNFNVLTKNSYDKIGRLAAVEKQIGSNPMKLIANYAYDDFGRLKTKTLDPGYTSGGNTRLEALKYSYNIHGQITGINQDYAKKTPGLYSKWGNFFGMYLGYANQDGVFASAQLNGQITGTLWTTQGEDIQRKYDYAYDNARRLKYSLFVQKEKPQDAWSSSKLDFTVGGAIGQISYDLNGNILNMQHRGTTPGNASSFIIDDLHYTYQAFSNKLVKVFDHMTTYGENGKNGDYTDGSNGQNNDYVYDANGNLIVDLNKNVHNLQGSGVGQRGIKYNFLDKPEEIKIVGKGVIRIVYSATGEKLQRIFTPESGSVVTTTYVNKYVYQSIGTGSDQLSFMLFEEGRIRVIQPQSFNNGYDTYGLSGNLSLPDGKQGVYDYFVTDHQQNVRMILSEEVQYASSTATMESSRAAQEEPIFGRSGAGNELASSRFATPSGWQNASVGAQVSRLGSLSGNMVGPNTLQKVMAGDQMSATVQYFFQSAPGNSTPLTTMLLNTLGQLLSTGSQVGGLVKGNASAVTSQLQNNIGFVNAVNPGQGLPGTPQAYLTMVFFDERFEPIAEADGGVVRQQVAQSVGSGGSTLGLGNIKAPRNGYVLVYVSNSSAQPVYFDNLQVGKVNGNILEENHYYSFGLRISAISSRRFTDQYQGETKNGYLYQGAFAELDDDIGWQDFALRSYDAQIGRFMQMDPFSQFASHYTGMGNDPVNMIDPSGGIGIVTPCPGSSLFLANIGNAISNVASALSSISPIVGYASSGIRTAAAVNNNVTQFNTVNRMMSVSMTSRVGFLPEGDKNGNRQDDFAPLTKTIFEDFVKNTRCRNCGKGTLQNTTGLYFQELFEEYIEENFNLAGFRVVSDPANNRLPGDFRSTVPDYFGMKYSLRDGRPIEITTFYELESFFELKATKNNIGLSSFEGQLQVQIQAARRLRVQEIVVVTTHGVRLTEPLKNYATGQGVRLTHYWAEYKILENNRMILNFVLAKYK